MADEKISIEVHKVQEDICNHHHHHNRGITLEFAEQL